MALNAAIENFKGPSAYESLLQEYYYNCDMHPELVGGQTFTGWLYDKFVGAVNAAAYKRKNDILKNKAKIEHQPTDKTRRRNSGGQNGGDNKSIVGGSQGDIEVKTQNPTDKVTQADDAARAALAD